MKHHPGRGRPRRPCGHHRRQSARTRPKNILLLRGAFEKGDHGGVIELASFQKFSPIHITFLEQVVLSIGVVFNMIMASMRTEELLQELKGRTSSVEKRTNELRGEKPPCVEVKNRREIAQASASLEGRPAASHLDLRQERVPGQHVARAAQRPSTAR